MLHKDSDKLKELIKAFQSAEQQVKSVVLSTRAKDLKEYQLRVDKRLDKVNIDLTKKSIDWAKKDMPVAYKDGVKSVDKGYSKAKIDANEIESTYIQLAQHIQHATDTQKQNIRNAIDRAEKENSYGATVGNVKDIIQEELAKDNPTMVVTYSNGAKMPLSAHAEMLARTSRIIAENQGSFARCGELGLDLVRCTTVPNCCPYCHKYEGKVYSISGKDKRFPALYETALQKGYDIMHPNCRHEFIPFVEDFEPKEYLKKIIEDSNHFEDLDKDDKLFKIYNKDQALHKQWIAEHREYYRLKEKLGDKMPYSTLAGFRRARRSNSEEYQRVKELSKDLTKQNENDKIKNDKIYQALGVKPKKPIPIIGAYKGANPNYTKDSSYKVNCQRCVQAYEFRRRGYNVIALPKPKTDNKSLLGNECFMPKGSTIAECIKGYNISSSSSSVIKQVENAPNGARFSIYTAWKGKSNSAHVFIAEKENGIIKYYDPQTGKEDVSDYFTKGRLFGCFRLDDKEIVDDIELIKNVIEKKKNDKRKS